MVKDFIILFITVHNLKLKNCSFLLNWNLLFNIFRLWKVKPWLREDICIQHMSLCPYIGGMFGKGQIERVCVEPSGEVSGTQGSSGPISTLHGWILWPCVQWGEEGEDGMRHLPRGRVLGHQVWVFTCGRLGFLSCPWLFPR